MPRTTLPLRPRIFHPLPPLATMIKRRKPRTSHPHPTFLRPHPSVTTLPLPLRIFHRLPPSATMIKTRRRPRTSYPHHPLRIFLRLHPLATTPVTTLPLPLRIFLRPHPSATMIKTRNKPRTSHPLLLPCPTCLRPHPLATTPLKALLRPRIFHPLPPSATMIKRRKPRTSHPLLPPCPTFLRPLPWEATNHPLLPPYPTCPHRPPPRTMMIRAKRTPRSRHRLPAHPRKEKPPALPARQAFRASRPSSLVENRANRLSPSRRESPRPRALRSPVRPSLEANHHHPPEVDPGRSV